jgi:hypothetical protein
MRVLTGDEDLISNRAGESACDPPEGITDKI